MEVLRAVGIGEPGALQRKWFIEPGFALINSKSGIRG